MPGLAGKSVLPKDQLWPNHLPCRGDYRIGVDDDIKNVEVDSQGGHLDEEDEGEEEEEIEVDELEEDDIDEIEEEKQHLRNKYIDDCAQELR